MHAVAVCLCQAKCTSQLKVKCVCNNFNGTCAFRISSSYFYGNGNNNLFGECLN